jgi:type II secretory pathway pseudopilin PulG
MNRSGSLACPRKRGTQDGESGFILLGVIILLALFTISLSVALPQIAREVQRDRELEAMHRGQQYARAIRLFYRQTGNFPTDIKQLENTNNIRYLRKRYQDPMTRSDWKLVYQGEVKPDIVEHGREFFGVPVPSSSGSIPSGLLQGVATTAPGGFANNGGVTNLIDPTTGQPVSGGSDNAGATSDAVQPTAPDGTTGTSNTTIGSRRIVGVCSFSPKKSIRVYKKQIRYSDWQFVYDPASDGIVGGANPGVNGPTPPVNSTVLAPPATTPTQTPPPSQ